MLRSLFSGISGLRSHQTMMDVTGNNIANVNTTGFKSSQTQFQDTLSQMLQAAGAPQGERGGTNPAQVGLGVRVAGITTNFGQGATQLTGRSTDLMISGDGFFMVRSNGEQMYTRAGAMNFDASGRMVTTEGAPLQGWMADATGTINRNGPMQDLMLPVGALMPPSATTSTTFGGNLPSDGTVTSISTPIEVFDAQGNARTLGAVFTRTSTPPAVPTTWDLTLTDPAGATTTVAVAFDASGNLTSAPTAAVGGIAVDLAGLTGYAGNNSVAALSQDGYETGALQAFTLGPDGVLTGVFSNSLKQPLGQLAIATFANATGLEKAGSSLFRTTANSGNALIGVPGEDGRGTLTGGALEMSNVDLAQEFTNLIVAQRGFQANSRIITSSDEILQDLVNLKR
ncbi:flagellar hook protein FlgE [Thalassiella azotivora]